MTAPSTKVGLGVLLSLAWPVVLARSTQAVMGFFDAIMTAPLGEASLAAATTGAINTFAIIMLPMGVVFIVQSFASQLSGAGDLVGARRYGWYGLIVSGITAVVALICLPLIGPVLGLFHYAPDVRELMTSYMVIRLFSMGAMIGSEAIGNWYGGHGNTRMQMVASVIAMVADIFLNWVLIYGKLGLPALGVDGAALGSSLGSLIGFVYLLVAYLRLSGVPRAIGKVASGARRLRRSELVRVIRFGLPNGLNWFLEFAAFALFINLVMADLGTATLAAFMVVLNINSVAFMPSFGLSSAGAILVGQSIGAGRSDEVPRIVRLTALTAMGWQFGVGLFYVAVPVLLMSWFAPPEHAADSDLLVIGATLLTLSAVWQLFDAAAIVIGEALRAAGDTAWCLYARIFLAWAVFTPVSLLVVRGFDGGHVGAILCVAGYIALLAIALFWRFRTGRWREIDLTGTREAELVA
jgi:MATE family multidrug resistance protein